MSVCTTDETAVCFYDNTTGRAFGPVFNSTAEAEGFLEWLEQKYQDKETFEHGNETLHYLGDPRPYRTDELEHALLIYREGNDG